MSHFIEIREVFSEILYPAQFIIEELLYVFHEQLTTNVGRSAPLQRYDKENCLFTFHLENANLWDWSIPIELLFEVGGSMIFRGLQI